MSEIVSGIHERLQLAAAGTREAEASVGSFEVRPVGSHKASELGKFGKQLQILQKVAEERGVPVKMYLKEGTPHAAIDLAKKKLGESKVIIFP